MHRRIRNNMYWRTCAAFGLCVLRTLSRRASRQWTLEHSPKVLRDEIGQAIGRARKRCELSACRRFEAEIPAAPHVAWRERDGAPGVDRDFSTQGADGVLNCRYDAWIIYTLDSDRDRRLAVARGHCPVLHPTALSPRGGVLSPCSVHVEIARRDARPPTPRRRGFVEPRRSSLGLRTSGGGKSSR
jgi:hypothetical protein